MRTRYLVVLAALASPPALAQHDHVHGMAADSAAPARSAMREWTRLPLLVPAMGRGGERSGAVLRPLGIDTPEVTVFAPGGPQENRRVAYPVGPEGVKFTSAGSQIGNYHWAQARGEGDGEVRVASTVWYFSNPGEAPTALLSQPKSELEIVPQPLPREHSSYREAEQWQFAVRWNGQPLANQKVTLETEFGSRSSFVSDAQGIVVALFPRDFRGQDARNPDQMGPRKAVFVLGTEYEAEGKRYLTAFNYTYSPDPARERSLGWGAAFGVLGMVAALPLLRRRTARTDISENNHA